MRLLPVSLPMSVNDTGAGAAVHTVGRLQARMSDQIDERPPPEGRPIRADAMLGQRVYSMYPQRISVASAGSQSALIPGSANWAAAILLI